MKSGRRKPRPLPAIMLANPADAEVEAASAGKGANGTSAGRAAGPANIRPVAPLLERRKGPAFDLLWPKGQRPQRAAEVKSSQTDVVPAMEAVKAAEQGNGPAPDADAATAGTSGSNPVSPTECPTRFIPTARLKRSCPKGYCVSARSPNCAITSSKVLKARMYACRRAA